MWDDGSVNPEPCLDKFDLVTKVCDGEPHLARLGLCTAPFPNCKMFRPRAAQRCAHVAVAYGVADVRGWLHMSYAMGVKPANQCLHWV